MSADIVAIAEAEAGHTVAVHTVAGRRVAGEGVARTLGARHMVAEAAAAARRNPLAVAADSIGRVEVRRRRVEEAAGLRRAGEMAHRRVAGGVVARSPGEVEEAADSIGPGREEERRTAAEAVAGNTPLAVGAAVDHKVGTRSKTSRETRCTSRDVRYSIDGSGRCSGGCFRDVVQAKAGEGQLFSARMV